MTLVKANQTSITYRAAMSYVMNGYPVTAQQVQAKIQRTVPGQSLIGLQKVKRILQKGINEGKLRRVKSGKKTYYQFNVNFKPLKPKVPTKMTVPRCLCECKGCDGNTYHCHNSSRGCNT